MQTPGLSCIKHINPNLHNAWGMAVSSGGGIWVSAADGGVSYVYNDKGKQLIPPVTIPSHVAGAPGNPTGQVYNETTDFVISRNMEILQNSFLQVKMELSQHGMDGASAVHCCMIVQTKVHDYTGIAIANDGGSNLFVCCQFWKT